MKLVSTRILTYLVWSSCSKKYRCMSIMGIHATAVMLWGCLASMIEVTSAFFWPNCDHPCTKIWCSFIKPILKVDSPVYYRTNARENYFVWKKVTVFYVFWGTRMKVNSIELRRGERVPYTCQWDWAKLWFLRNAKAFYGVPSGLSDCAESPGNERSIWDSAQSLSASLAFHGVPRKWETVVCKRRIIDLTKNENSSRHMR